MTHFDFSSDLDMGGPPELKFDEKSKCIILFIKLLSSEDLFTAEKVLHLFGALPHDRCAPHDRRAEMERCRLRFREIRVSSVNYRADKPGHSYVYTI